MRGLNTTIAIDWPTIGLIGLGILSVAALMLWLLSNPNDKDRR